MYNAIEEHIKVELKNLINLDYIVIENRNEIDDFIDDIFKNEIDNRNMFRPHISGNIDYIEFFYQALAGKVNLNDWLFRHWILWKRAVIETILCDIEDDKLCSKSCEICRNYPNDVIQYFTIGDYEILNNEAVALIESEG